MDGNPLTDLVLRTARMLPRNPSADFPAPGGGLVPGVENADFGATNITVTSAVLNGYLVSTGTAPTEVWVYWTRNSKPWGSTRK